MCSSDLSHSFIDELEFSHSFPTRTTLSVSRPKQHDHSKSRSTFTVSRPKQHNPQDKPQQDLNRMTNLTDLKKSVTALVVEMDSLGSAKEKEADLTHLLNVLSLSIEAHGLHGKASNLHHHHLLRWFYL